MFQLKSLTFQTIFLAFTALQLIFIPNVFLSTFGFDTTIEIWIKVIGIILLALSVVYFGINRYANTSLIKITVLARLTAGIGLIILVLTGEAKSSLFIFAALDMATAIWTYFEIKNE